MRNKRKQKALMQYWMPQNADLVREALHDAGRQDLIGRSRDSLVPHHERSRGERRSGGRKKHTTNRPQKGAPKGPRQGRRGRGKPQGR